MNSSWIIGIVCGIISIILIIMIIIPNKDIHKYSLKEYEIYYEYIDIEPCYWYCLNGYKDTVIVIKPKNK